jgi:hypothetical protein
MQEAVRQSRPLASPVLEFEAFKPLPCGCVAVVHRTLDPGLDVISLEAKGTYCGLNDHVLGRLTAVPSAVITELEFAELAED